MIKLIGKIGVLCLIVKQVAGILGPQSQYAYNETEPTAGPFRWNITLIESISINRPSLYPGVYRLKSTYLLDDNYYDMELFKYDCETSPTGIDNFPLEFYNASNSISNGENEVEFEWTYNQTKIQESDLWVANKTGGEVSFCIRVNNYLSETGDDFAIGVNYLEVLYKIEVDFLTDFNGTIDIARTNAISGSKEEINYEEDIKVYRCNDSYQEIINPLPLVQGEYLQICVQTIDDSMFGIHSIKEMELSQNGTKRYRYFDNFVPSPLTDASCKEMFRNTTLAVCYAKVQLLAYYFEEDNPPAVSIVGTVKLDYVGRRNLMDMTNLDMRDPFGEVNLVDSSLYHDDRRLEGTTAEVGFTLDVQLSSFSTSYENNASTTVPFTASVLLSQCGVFAATVAAWLGARFTLGMI